MAATPTLPPGDYFPAAGQPERRIKGGFKGTRTPAGRSVERRKAQAFRNSPVRRPAPPMGAGRPTVIKLSRHCRQTRRCGEGRLKARKFGAVVRPEGSGGSGLPASMAPPVRGIGVPSGERCVHPRVDPAGGDRRPVSGCGARNIFTPRRPGGRLGEERMEARAARCGGGSRWGQVRPEGSRFIRVPGGAPW